MKVPHQITGRTRPTAGGMDPLRVQVDADAFGAGIGRGIAQIGAGLAVHEQEVKQREDKTHRFQAMTNFSEFETQANNHLAELKRTADPTGIGFTAKAEAEYEKMANDFIMKSVQPELQEEARYWTSNTKQRILADSMNFQYEAGDAYFRTEINKAFQDQLKGLDPTTGGDPASLKERQASLNETIDASDLSEIEKEKLKWDTSVALEGVVYKQAYKKQRALGKGKVPDSVGAIIEEAAGRYGLDAEEMKAIAWIESRGNPGAKNPSSSAGGLFQQIDSNAAAYGVADRFDAAQSAEGAMKFAVQNKAYLEGKLGRPLRAGELYLAHQQGPAGALKLLQNPDRPAVDAVGWDAVRLNGGAPGMTAGQFADLWREKVAKAQGVDLDSLPLFSHVPYEDRVALQADGEAEFIREQNAAAEAEKFRINTLTNELMVGLHDGLKGQTDIDAARAEGWLSDYDAIARAQKVYEDRNAEGLLVQRTVEKLSTGQTFDPTNTDDQKGLNALIGKQGLAAIDGMDQGYVTNGLIPMVTQAGDIPTDASGLLSGMIRSNNQQKAIFAFEALAQLQDADPRAFDGRIPDSVAADVNFYRQNRTLLPQDELFEAINGGRTQAERQGREILYQEAQDILKTKTEGVSSLSTMVQDVAGTFDGWTSSARQIGVPAFAKQLSFDYEAAFINAYMKRPDTEWANAEATRQIQRDWGVSEAGGILMKHPPEKAGYPPVLGGYDWIDEQAKDDLQLGPDERYELISDDKTASELAQYRLGRGPAPSYQVVVYDAAGTPHTKMFSTTDGPKGEEVFVETNNPARIRFRKNEVHVAAETTMFGINEINARLGELFQERSIYQYPGMEDMEPPELKHEMDDLLKQREALGEEFLRLQPKRKPLKINPETELKPSRRGPAPFMINRAIDMLR